MTATWLKRFSREGHLWHGLQLALVIVLAHAAARVTGLPESHWAAMSALIVSRADASATLQAGGQRLLATLLGAVAGLLGVAVAHALPGIGREAIGLAVVALLAAATADRIGWRTAPITALIVLGTASHPGESAITAAALRTANIAVGAGVAMATAWVGYRLAVGVRPLAVVAALLRELAAQVEAAPTADAEQREALSRDARATLRRLGEMLHGTRDDGRRKLLGLAMRLGQDAAWLARQLAAPEPNEAAAPLAVQAATALRAAAARLDGGSESPRDAIGALAGHAGPAWQTDAVALLADDLAKLLKVAGSQR
jgi:uncharacterized membrane protein YccC